MNKRQFIERLENELIENDVKNIKDILNEYENHFEEGKKVGKSEEEICESLGSPEMIANEYTNKAEKELEIKKARKNFEKIVAIALCCIVLIISLIVLVPVVSRKIDDRNVTIIYDQNELSLKSVKEYNVNDFRFLSDEFEVDKGEEFYLVVEQKNGYIVKSIKIDGEDRTNDLLSLNSGNKLNGLSDEIKNLIVSNKDSVFIKIVVNDDITIEIVSE